MADKRFFSWRTKGKKCTLLFMGTYIYFDSLRVKKRLYCAERTSKKFIFDCLKRLLLSAGSWRLSAREYQGMGPSCDREAPTTESAKPITCYCLVMSTGRAHNRRLAMSETRATYFDRLYFTTVRRVL